MNLLWFFHSSPSLKMSLKCSNVCSQIILEKPTLVCFRASWICRQNYQDVLKLVVLRILGVIQIFCLKRRLGWTNLLRPHNRRGQLQDRGQGKDQPVQNNNLILFSEGNTSLPYLCMNHCAALVRRPGTWGTWRREPRRGSLDDEFLKVLNWGVKKKYLGGPGGNPAGRWHQQSWKKLLS